MRYLIWFVIFIVGIVYLLRFQLRRWWRVNITNRNLPPHERWPEILHWEKGDSFDLPYGYRRTQCDLVSLCEDGYAAVEFCGDRWWVPISDLVGRNNSLRTRKVDTEIRRDKEYMQLIEEFQRAYRELQQRDRNNQIAA